MEVNGLNIWQAIGMIAGVCAAAFVTVLVKIAVKESHRITHNPVQLEMAEPAQGDDKQAGLREGAAYSPTRV
ncbi:MAG: hypothetical protein LAO03_22635 [Acidobacteriia bacterium]|nr:hypothetical protein [Terriglobia bacterium]